MYLKIQHFVTFITILLCTSCYQDAPKPIRIEGKQVVIDSIFLNNEAVEDFVKPYRNRINEILDSTLAFAPKMISKTDGTYNSSAGNLMADIVYTQANPIFKSRTGKEIDFVLLNHGGIRSIISAGKVSARNAFEVMPFENLIVVAEVKGSDVSEMVSFLIREATAHPIAGMQLILDKNMDVRSFTIQGKPLQKDRIYYVATSDYLVSGGDDMGYFKSNTKITNTDYLIRNAMIDYFKKVDTLAPRVDNRFYID